MTQKPTLPTNAGFVGTDSFTYSLSDGDNVSEIVTASVTIRGRLQVSIDRTLISEKDGELWLTINRGIANLDQHQGLKSALVQAFNLGKRT